MTVFRAELHVSFTGAALKLLIALMMYLYKSENEIKTFGRVIRLLNSVRYKNGSIDMSCELARCLNKHASVYPYDAATTNWNGMQSNAQETQSSIIRITSAPEKISPKYRPFYNSTTL